MDNDQFSFFDPAKSKQANSASKGSSASAPMSVSSLLTRIKNAIAEAFPTRVSVVGEISNFKLHSSGHMYFRIKDADAAIDVAMFRSAASKLKFRPQDGLEVVVTGKVDVYHARGQLQFYAERLTPQGQGALELAFRQLREKLSAEGLFDPATKKPIPRFPRAIGIVTSPTGAAVQDIRRTLNRRWPGIKAYVMPAMVQGQGAAESVANAISLLDANAQKLQLDTIIVARGGGSIEDLWAFNEEPVARAVFSADTPIISGIGHEVDVSICDMVADLRAATPTAAAELAVADATELTRHVRTLAGRLTGLVTERVSSARAVLNGLARSNFLRDPAGNLRSQIQRTDELSHRLAAATTRRCSSARMRFGPLADRLAIIHPAARNQSFIAALERLQGRLMWALSRQARLASDRLTEAQSTLRITSPTRAITLARQKVDAVARQLEAMSYRSVLARGFSVTRLANGEILRSVAQVADGDTIRTELADGQIKSVAGSSKASDRQPRNTDKRQAPVPRKRGEEDGPGLFD